MNIAVGNAVEMGKILGTFDVKSYLIRLMDEKFNGYVCITALGKTGLEEGLLIFHNGLIASSDYEYYKYNKRFKAEEGLKRTLNAFYAKNGVVDSFSLSVYQVQLILTLNEECNLHEKIGKENLKLPESFSFSFEEELMEKKEEVVSKEVLLKKYGLARLFAPGATRKELIESMKKEHEFIEKSGEE